MARYQVNAPDGSVYEFEAPDDASPEQLDAMSREVAHYASNYPVAEGAAPSVGQTLLQNTENDVAGLAQGAAGLPDMMATAAGKVMSVVPTVAGYAMDALNPGSGEGLHDFARTLANPPTIGDGIEAIAPTPEGGWLHANRVGAQLVGGVIGMPASAMENLATRIIGEVPKSVLPQAAAKVAAAGQEVVDAGEKVGVRVLTSDVKPPRTFIGKSVQATGEKIPLAGTGPVRSAQQIERIDAVKNIARDYGAMAGDELTVPAIDSVAQSLAARRGAELTRLTGLKNGVIDSIPGAVPVNNAVAAIDEQIANLKSLKSADYAPVIAKLQDWKQSIQGQSLKNIEALRKQFGEAFKAPELAAIRGIGEKALSAIYEPLRADMGAFIKANGKPSDYMKWAVANKKLAGMAGELKAGSLRSVLRNIESTPEDVGKLLFSQKPSDVRRLYASLPEAGRAKAQAAILQRAVTNAGGVESLSADRFATQMTKLARQTGIFFRGDDLARVNGLTRVLKATKRAAEASVAPPTGVQNVPYAMGAGLTAVFGLAGGIGTAGGLGLLARAYESAPVRNLLLSLGRTKPGSAAEAKLTSRASAAITSAVQSRGTAANDTIPAAMGAAASPDGSDPQSVAQ